MASDRVLSITQIYYSKPDVQKVLFDFSKRREVVPRYANGGFGKRPDTLQYPSDLLGAVKRGATSFHASEEIWRDPLRISSDMSQDELSELRDSWDLLIDIDSPYLDYSKISARLICEALEKQGVRSYGVKFSGSKGFHIIVPSDAFPKEFQGQETRKMFPEWPRAIANFLIKEITSEYNKIVSKQEINFKALEERTGLSKEDVTQSICPECSSFAKKTTSVTLECNRCGNLQKRPDYKKTKRVLRCIDERCPGFYELKEEKEMFKCIKCGYSSFDKNDFETKNVLISTPAARNNKFSSDFKEEVIGSEFASPDLVLVSPRHLFRMPYSLHEKTCLASAVLTKEELDSFSPKDADPLKVKIRNFYPLATKGEATSLLDNALKWQSEFDKKEEKKISEKYQYSARIDISGVTEEQFPASINKLLKGLKEGRKRGLFILLTFLKTLGFSPEYINSKVREWNKKNDPPLKEGYVKSQIDWHLKQKKQILPPNYDNKSFYRDLNLIGKETKDKNPVSEVLRKVKSSV